MRPSLAKETIFLSKEHQNYSIILYLLKLATMIGMGRVIHRTPQMAQREPTNFPAEVVGATSPYPVLVMVMMAQYSAWGSV